MSVQTGVARSGTVVMLPSDKGDGAMHAGTEKVPNNNDTSLLDSPILLAYDPTRNRRVTDHGQEQVPIQNGDGTLLVDEDE